MLKILNFLRLLIFFLILSFTAARLFAQKTPVYRFADLPVIIYSTSPLQTDNKDSINFWMRRFATMEVAHLDNI